MNLCQLWATRWPTISPGASLKVWTWEASPMDDDCGRKDLCAPAVPHYLPSPVLKPARHPSSGSVTSGGIAAIAAACAGMHGCLGQLAPGEAFPCRATHLQSNPRHSRRPPKAPPAQPTKRQNSPSWSPGCGGLSNKSARRSGWRSASPNRLQAILNRRPIMAAYSPSPRMRCPQRGS